MGIPLLSLVTELEDEADKIAADAKVKADAIAADAAAAADRVANERRAAAEEDARAIQANERSILDSEIAEVRSREEAQHKQSMAGAGAKLSAAADLVLKRLRGQS